MDQMSTSIKRIKRNFIIIFAVLFIIPLIQGNVKFIKYNFLWENRQKVPFPTNYGDLINPNSNFSKQFEHYFNDIFSLRDFFIRLKSQIDFSFFNTSDKIVIGKEGWLFYKNLTEDTLVEHDRLSDLELEKYFRGLKNLSFQLKKQGTTLVILPIPLKNSVYPEYLPDTAPKRPPRTTLVRYMNFLKAQKEIEFIDVTKSMLNMKKRFPVFHKTDFHWTPRAGVEICSELINLLGKLSGTQIRWNHRVEYKKIEKWIEGNEGEQLAIFTRPVEIIEEIIDQAQLKLGKLILSEPMNVIDFKADSSDPKISFLPPTLLLGDSFAHHFLHAGYLRYFREFQKRPKSSISDKIFDLARGKKFLILEHIEVFPEILYSPIWNKFNKL